MIKLLDILREAKQVGDIYHFTRLSRRFGIYDILNSGELKPASRSLVSRASARWSVLARL